MVCIVIGLSHFYLGCYTSFIIHGSCHILTHIKIVKYQKCPGIAIHIAYSHFSREIEKEKRRDGCKHSWLLKGEIYSWVIKVYDWIHSGIGRSKPRGTRSMNMNFMLLSILCSSRCISSELSCVEEISFFAEYWYETTVCSAILWCSDPFDLRLPPILLTGLNDRRRLY